MNKKKLFKKHLLDFGLRYFSESSKYNSWVRTKYLESKISREKKIKFQKYLSKHQKSTKYKLGIEFYDLIAENIDLLYLTHSMKFTDILESGFNILRGIENNKIVLDIGCNAGYQTSFYAIHKKYNNFIGIDISKKSIDLAKKKYRSQEFPNLRFVYKYNDLKKIKFDIITDSQCLCTLNNQNLNKILNYILPLLKNDGNIISVSNLPTESITENFLNKLKKKNLFIKKIKPIFVNTLFGIQVYSKLELSKLNNNFIIDVNSYFKKLRKKLSILNITKFI